MKHFHDLTGSYDLVHIPWISTFHFWYNKNFHVYHEKSPLNHFHCRQIIHELTASCIKLRTLRIRHQEAPAMLKTNQQGLTKLKSTSVRGDLSTDHICSIWTNPIQHMDFVQWRQFQVRILREQRWNRPHEICFYGFPCNFPVLQTGCHRVFRDVECQENLLDDPDKPRDNKEPRAEG